MNKVILAVDIGTSSLKASLIDMTGTVLSDARCRFPSGKRMAKDWLDAFADALRILAPPPDLGALVISGNGPTLVSVGKKDEPLALLLWNDPINIGHGKTAQAGKGSVAGESPENPSIFIPRLKAFRDQNPEGYENAKWIFSGPEYLIYCLTGNAVTILPESRFERAYWTRKDLEAVSLDGSKLPPFVFPASINGVTDGRFPFLSAGVPVIAGGPDFIVALIGTGALEAGKACDRAGTSEGLNVCVSTAFRYPQIRTLPSVMDGLWNASYLLSETGAMFHRYRKESGQTGRSYPDLMKEIEESPIFPLTGEALHPGRAVVEKIGFSVRTGIEVLRKATGISPVFYLSGGQARNEIWNQLKADITGSVFALTATPDGELMGDAVIGFTALGEYASLKEAARQMVHIKRIYEPDPEKHVYYSEKFALYENL